MELDAQQPESSWTASQLPVGNALPQGAIRTRDVPPPAAEDETLQDARTNRIRFILQLRKSLRQVVTDAVALAVRCYSPASGNTSPEAEVRWHKVEDTVKELNGNLDSVGPNTSTDELIRIEGSLDTLANQLDPARRRHQMVIERLGIARGRVHQIANGGPGQTAQSSDGIQL